jgi:hypothetical protein
MILHVDWHSRVANVRVASPTTAGAGRRMGAVAWRLLCGLGETDHPPITAHAEAVR